ncbi:MAG: carbohydrate-binding domain-containing protein [Candidatus Bathyarchaeota archaeon]
MAKRRLMLLLGAICILLIVAGYVNLNWSPDVTSTIPGENTTDDNTTDDNTDPTTDTSTDTDDDTTRATLNITIAEAIGNNEVDHEDEEDYIWDSSDVITITLNIDSISVDDENGTTIDETTVTITSAGTYNISGTLVDGQIVVDTDDQEVVRLILNGVNISSTTNAPVYVANANKTVIVLADNTENYLTDNEGNGDNGTLLSRDDLTIYGNGSLTVSGNANDAIRSNDGLIIKSGNITVTSVDDGIRGKNYLVIKGGNITVNSVGDGLKSDNAEEEGRGYISIEECTIAITSTEGDTITAQTDLLVTGGIFTLTSGGGSAVTPDDVSTKGLKAGVIIVIDDGNFTINSSDDAIHSDHMILINNGTYHIASGDDGIHADTSLEINNGTVVISQSYEGLESTIVTINNGHILINSSDDGINVAEGNGGAGGGFGPPGEFYIYINGGFIYIDSGCDGLDSDGYIEMTGGVVIINGPVPGSFPNGAIDYGTGSFNLTGGTLVAVGSSDMAQGPSTISTQYSVIVNFNSTQSSNTLVNIQTASGETVLTFRPTKSYQSIVFSSHELAPGSYDLYLGGTSTGTPSDGIYEDETYTPGTEYTSFTISGIVTTVGGGGFWGW